MPPSASAKPPTHTTQRVPKRSSRLGGGADSVTGDGGSGVGGGGGSAATIGGCAAAGGRCGSAGCAIAGGGVGSGARGGGRRGGRDGRGRGGRRGRRGAARHLEGGEAGVEPTQCHTALRYLDLRDTGVDFTNTAPGARAVSERHHADDREKQDDDEAENDVTFHDRVSRATRHPSHMPVPTLTKAAATRGI